jgi:hypothetical protein
VPILACSYTLVMMMYQLPIDMMTRMPSVMRATRSPPFHNASRPYGFSMTSVVFSPTLAGAAGAPEARRRQYRVPGLARRLGAATPAASVAASERRPRRRQCRRQGNEQSRSEIRQTVHLQHVVSTRIIGFSQTRFPRMAGRADGATRPGAVSGSLSCPACSLCRQVRRHGTKSEATTRREAGGRTPVNNGPHRTGPSPEKREIVHKRGRMSIPPSGGRFDAFAGAIRRRQAHCIAPGACPSQTPCGGMTRYLRCVHA